MSDVPYTGGKRAGIPAPDDLRARIPGWGADLDPADRPAVPREIPDGTPAGVDWTEPEDQVEQRPRERSIEHARLTPVYGTTAPLRGVSGAIRKVAYARFSEARAAHWLLLLAADRVESKGAALRSMASGRPDNPITETGVLSEWRRHGLSSRVRRDRVDVGHHAMDPVIVAAPWVVGGWVALQVAKRAARGRG